MRYVSYESAEGAECVKCKRGFHVGLPHYVEAYREHETSGVAGVKHPEHMIWLCDHCGYPLKSACAE